MTDDERFERHEDILRSLTAMLVQQNGFNERLTLANERLTLANERLTLAIERIDRTLAQQAEINADMKITLARVETLFTRVFRPQENGRDA